MKNAASLLERVLQGSAGGDAALDEVPVPGVGIPESDEGIDVEAVGPVGRHPAGGGVRLLQEAQILQVGHDVAQCGGGDLETAGAGELLAPHRATRGDVLADDRVENVAGPIGKRLGHIPLTA
jgi:hypothetical protein